MNARVKPGRSTGSENQPAWPASSAWPLAIIRRPHNRDPTDAYDQRARAHDGLTHAYQASDEAAKAHEHWLQALACYTKLGMPKADRVRADLTNANPRTAPDGTHR